MQYLRQELTSLNSEAQFQNEKLHSFLATFIPDYKLIKEPELSEKVLPEPQKVPRIEVKIVDEKAPEKVLPIPTVSYEWSNSRSIDNYPAYLPKLGKNI